MKIIKFVEKSKTPWTKRVTCGPFEGSPPVKGCGSEVELSEKDIYYREMVVGANAVGRTFNWKCPSCQATNYLAMSDIPSIDLPSQKKHFEDLRKETMLEIAKLYPFSEQAQVIISLGDEFLLDDDIVRSVIGELAQ